jgi:hypothetical protein
MGMIAWIGRTALRSLQVLAGVLSALGAGGTTGNGPAPTPPPERREDYRP